MRILAFASLAAFATSAGADELVDFSTLPKGTFFETRTEAGVLHAYPRDKPTGPYYIVNGDKITGVEFILTQADLAAGKSWPDLGVYEGLGAVDHINLTFHKVGWGDRFATKSVYVLEVLFASDEEVAALR